MAVMKAHAMTQKDGSIASPKKQSDETLLGETKVDKIDQELTTLHPAPV